VPSNPHKGGHVEQLHMQSGSKGLLFFCCFMVGALSLSCHFKGLLCASSHLVFTATHEVLFNLETSILLLSSLGKVFNTLLLLN
jgi:hypothetical protein